MCVWVEVVLTNGANIAVKDSDRSISASVCVRYCLFWPVDALEFFIRSHDFVLCNRCFAGKRENLDLI